MIVSLIKSNRIFSLTLPSKVKGSFWLSDLDAQGSARRLISVEAQEGYWILNSNPLASVLDGNKKKIPSAVIFPQGLFHLQIAGEEERVTLYAETIDDSRQRFRKIFIRNPGAFQIGRAPDNQICFDNKYASSHHAVLSYDGKVWSIRDLSSTNGTFVDGIRVQERILKPGEMIYIMGLKIIIGSNYFAINNPDQLVKLQAGNLSEYVPQKIKPIPEVELPAKQLFFRSPRFRRNVEPASVKIDPPPNPPKQETTPMALMIGPSLTMAMTSVSTSVLTVSNVVSSNGNISQAMPSMLMAVGTLMGALLWPSVTRKYETKARIRNERKRHEKYLAYLDSIRDDLRRYGKEQSDILAETLVGKDECISRILGQKPQLWERGLQHEDFLQLRLGTGSLPMYVSVSCPEKRFTMDDDTLQDAMLALGSEPKQLENVPISLSLTQTPTVGIYGSRSQTRDLLHGMLLQMVALHGYDELKLMLICDEEDLENWSFVRSIPHFWSDDKKVRFLAANPGEVKELSAYMEKNILSRGDERNRSFTDTPPYYTLICASSKLGKKCEALQHLLKFQSNCGFSVIFAEAELRDLPKESNLAILANGPESRMFDREDVTGKGITFAVDLVDRAQLMLPALTLANTELNLQTQQYTLPNMLTFLEMFNVSKIEHLNVLTRWKENNPTKTLQTPVGVGTNGELFWLDLHEKFHGPHGLVAGMTGSGKSEFIITYILSLAVNYHPDEVAFILIDYKGGGLTGAFEDTERGIKLPHLAGTITNLDGAAVKRSLVSIQSELRRRQAIFNEVRRISNEGTMDIYKYQQLYRDKVVSEPIPHLFIISDEFAELKTQQPEFMEQLISAARIGRSLGVHLILATQKPAGVVDDQIWSNSRFRVCLKVQEKNDSQDMIKCPDAAEISQTGRFYLQVGFNELFEMGQSAWCGAEYIPSETVGKTKEHAIQAVDNLGRVILSAKQEKERVSGTKVKQIVSIVKMLSDLAQEESITVRPLWLDPIPQRIFIDQLEEKYSIQDTGFQLCPVVGEYDDPFNQKQAVLTVPFSKEGNCLIYGATGNGKSTFLTAIAYSLIRHHSADQTNLYIMDFGSETLRAFEQAPQVGGVMGSADEEKVRNCMKLLTEEMESRKALFSEFGGDHATYCRTSGKTVPSLVVLMNNFSGFAEQFEDLLESFTLLTREGVKYGIFFAITASSTNAVRYQIQQNFSILLTMQLNDPSDYPVVVGKTGGLIPSHCKGRGLVALDSVYEFQTAYCTDTPDTGAYLRSYCKQLRQKANRFAKPVPVLPEQVLAKDLLPQVQGAARIPVGIVKETITVASVNLANKVLFPVTSLEEADIVSFLREYLKLLPKAGKTVLVDAAHLVGAVQGVKTVSDNFEPFVAELFAEMVQRNNTYKDAKLDVASLDRFEERIYVIVGMKKLQQQLTDDGKDKLRLLLSKAESFYKLHFILADTVSQITDLSTEEWYRRHVSSSDGLWIGDDVTEQYLLKISRLSSSLYEPVGSSYGYLFSKGRMQLVKLLKEDR